MDDKEITIRGLALSKFDSIADFARSIGWTRNKASRILNGVTDPNIKDIEKMAKLLKIDTQERFMRFFFPEMSTLWTP